jgi:uncharacterized protein
VDACPDGNRECLFAALFRTYYKVTDEFAARQVRMTKLKSFFKLITEPGLLVALTVAIAMLVGIVSPASAQFFFNPFASRPSPPPRQGGGGHGWFGSDFFQPFQPQQPKRVYQDYSKAPPPEHHDNANAPERYVLVLGDAMADWLAYGLEDAYAEQPDMGVVRKGKNGSGLIKYQSKGEPADWAAAAKGILAADRADAIVVMLGLNDRVSLHEPAVEKTDDKKADKAKKDAKGKDQGKDKAKEQSKDQKPGDTAAKPDDKPADTDLPQDDADNDDGVAAPEKTVRSPNGIAEFHDDRWVELYTKKIEEMIGVLKSKGVPVIWVGLPAVRGPKGTADALFLDSLYRDAAGKAGITYVDVWDGFVDEGGRFMQKGPDFEGQPRSLRSPDGVYFTRAGARKLAHYVEREITRALAGRSAPIELPSEPATPDANAPPGQPAPRPIAGPILPLVASSVGTDQLLGGPGGRPAAVDALAARTLVKGEALSPPAGRADDYVWPRREVGREQAKEPPKEPSKEQGKPDTPVAATTPGETNPATPAAAPTQQKQKRITAPTAPSQSQPSGAGQSIRDFFGFGGPQLPQKPPAPHNPAPTGPRPVGRAAAAQDQPAR